MGGVWRFFGILIIALMSFWTRISFMDSGCGLVFFLRMGLNGVLMTTAFSTDLT